MASALRRRLAWTFAVLLLIVLLLFGAWLLMGPTVVARILGPHLPMRLDEGLTVRSFATAPSGLDSEFVFSLSPSRARAIASEAMERWLPPTVLRNGMTALGEWRIEDAQKSLFFAATLDRAREEPLLQGNIPSATLDALLRLWCRDPIDFIGDTRVRYRPKIAPGSTLKDSGNLVATDGGLVREFAAAWHGEIDLNSDGRWHTVPVSRLDGTITLTFPGKLGGHGLEISVAIAALEYVAPKEIALLSSDAMRKILEKLINTELAEAEGLQELILPDWLPLDSRVDLRVK